MRHIRHTWQRLHARALTLALSITLALTATLAAGCGTVTSPQSPGAMNLDIKVKYYQQGSSPVEAHFSTADGSTVEFVSGETVACNGTFLAYQSKPLEQLFDYGSYVGQVAMQPASGSYTFTYTPAQGKGSPITVSVPVVNAPVDVTSPANGASVALPKNNNNQPVTIQYTPTQVANTTILAILIDSRGTATFTLPQPETGTISVPANQLSNFQAGPGVIYVVRITSNQISGTPFRQVKTEFDNITVREMVWQ